MVSYYTEKATALPRLVAAQIVAEHLAADGWTEVTSPGMGYGRYYFRYQTVLPDVCFVKEYTESHGVSGTSVHMALSVNPLQLVDQAHGVRPTAAGFDPAVHYYTAHGEARHPHTRGEGMIPCYHFTQGMGLAALPPAGVAAVMVALVRGFPKSENPNSIANGHQWKVCQSCGKMDYVQAGQFCPTCNSFWCSVHKGARCRRCPAPIETPEGMEPWQYRAARFQWPVAIPLVESCLLVGCGVTGSWAAPVLNRLCGTVGAIDMDTIAHPTYGTGDDTYMNRNGLWVRPGVAAKADAIEVQHAIVNRTDNLRNRLETDYLTRNPRHPVAAINRHRPFTNRFPLPEDLDLLVLCLDTAQARLLAKARMARRILDVRGTLRGVLFWALPGKTENRGKNARRLWAIWKATLDRQVPAEAQRCGEHHDAVPLSAGTVTAWFLAQWIPAGMPVGYWEMPYAIEGLEPMPLPEVEPNGTGEDEGDDPTDAEIEEVVALADGEDMLADEVEVGEGEQP